jgi:hypothetical protein
VVHAGACQGTDEFFIYRSQHGAFQCDVGLVPAVAQSHDRELSM